MTTSGSTDFELDVADIIEEAYERCGIEVRTGYEAKTARRSLNILFAEWANRGLNLWTIKFATQTVAEGVIEYPLGAITMTIGASTSFTVGETITGGTSGATAAILTKPSSTTVTLSVPTATFAAAETITGGTSAATTTVTSSPSLESAKAVGDLLDVVIRRDSSDITINTISRGEYLTIPNKSTTGRPTQYYFARTITPTVSVWPTPENSTDELRYYYVERIQDADSLVNTADLPYRFYPCMIAGLAYYLSVKKAPERVQILKALYEEEFLRAAQEDEEAVSLKLQPSISYLRV